MELRHLRYFIAVAEELSFTRAAQRLHIAQPPLSVQIRQLEDEVGTSLFSREGHKNKLTEAGRAFLAQARRTLSEAERGITLARQAVDGEVGHLTIGYNAPAGFLVFPKVVPAFKRARPNVQLTFHALSMPQQLEGLRREDLDLGFVWLPVSTAEFDVRELIQDVTLVVLPAAHPLARQKDVSVRDLSGEPMIVPSRALTDKHFEIVRLFQRAKSVLHIVYELEQSLSIINFVAMGLGCALLPSYVRSIRQKGVVYRPLRSPPELVNRMAVIKKKGRGGLAQSFVKFTTELLPGPLNNSHNNTLDDV